MLLTKQQKAEQERGEAEMRIAEVCCLSYLCVVDMTKYIEIVSHAIWLGLSVNCVYVKLYEPVERGYSSEEQRGATRESKERENGT